MGSKLSKLLIVTPALADANNGNWQTARRWALMLKQQHRVQVLDRWSAGDTAGGDADADDDADLMVALHARRSASSVQAWRQHMGSRPLLLVLTGTDLYRDIQTDPQAQASMQAADRLLVLNELGLRSVPEALRSKAQVCLQSCPAYQTQTKTQRHLRALMVGHLREEKSPQTYFDAAQWLQHRHDIRLDHIGAGLDAELAQRAHKLSQRRPGSTPSHDRCNYRWLGALPHRVTRARIAAAHLLVHCSRMEGGAHVVMEAITSGTPVLASRIDGNVGLLGADYGGYFEWGDAQALATLLQRARDEPAMLNALSRQCRARAPLFEPQREQTTLLSVVAALLLAST